MDSEQLNERFYELEEKGDEFKKRQLEGSAMKMALEAKRFAKTHRLLMPYLHACFSVTNHAQLLFEPEIGADHALEIIALVESEEKARKFQHDYDEDFYNYTVHWISACAYDNLAKHTASRNGYNSPVVHGAVDDGIHVCRRTGKLECVDCFREYAVNICCASGDYEMGEHYARICATSTVTKNTGDRRFVGCKDLIRLSILQGHLAAGFELLQAAIPLVEPHYDPLSAGIELAHQAELLCLLSGREDELADFLKKMGHAEGTMPGIPERVENPFHHLDRTVNEAVRATRQGDFAAAESILAEEERFLLGQQDLDHWFGIRVQRLANLFSAGEAGVDLGVDRDSLREELRRRANIACQWSATMALDAMLADRPERRVRLNPLGIAFPIDIGPYATEGTSVSVSPLRLSLPLFEKSDEKSPAAEPEKDKTPFESEVDAWLAALEPLWTALAEHEHASEDAATPFPLDEELAKLEQDVYEKITGRTPEMFSDENGEPDFLAATKPLLRMRLMRNPDRVKECWTWLRRMQAKFPRRGRSLSTLAYFGFLFRNQIEGAQIDPATFELPSKEELEQWISQAFELEPNRTGIATVGGMIYRAHGNRREAQRYFSRANQIDRLNEFAAVSLAELYEEAERPKDAMATIELYTRSGGRHPGLLWQGMQIAYRNEMPTEFLLYYDAYTENLPSYPALDVQRIWALCRCGRLSEALAGVDVIDKLVDADGKDRLFLRALCQAELGDAAWLTTLEKGLECENPETPVGETFDPCGLLWQHVRGLPENDRRRNDFVRFLFERGLVQDDYFMPDDETEAEETEGQPPLKGYFRCIIKQALDPEIPAYAGWIRIPDAEYLAFWLVLADDAEEAGRLTLEAQGRCYPLPAELLECEQLDSYYARVSQVVVQGRRFPPPSED